MFLCCESSRAEIPKQACRGRVRGSSNQGMRGMYAHLALLCARGFFVRCGYSPTALLANDTKHRMKFLEFFSRRFPQEVFPAKDKSMKILILGSEINCGVINHQWVTRTRPENNLTTVTFSNLEKMKSMCKRIINVGICYIKFWNEYRRIPSP